MATSVAIRSKTDVIQEYFRRQYVTEEGDLEANLRALVSDDLVYHVGDERLSVEGLLKLTEGIRRSPKADRVVEMTDFEERDDQVSFHLRIAFRDADTGVLKVNENDHLWRFDAAGKVVDIRPKDAEAITSVVKGLGIEIEK